MPKAVPAVKKSTLPVDIRTQLSKQAEDITKRLGAPGGDRIRVTQDKQFVLPDGTQSPGPIQAIIVDFVTAHYYYESDYDENDISPPACAAIGLEPVGMKPLDNARDKQHDNCDSCPQNQFNSGRGKGKACQNTRLLALLPPDATEETPLQILRVSPTALRAFDSYVASLSRTFQLPPIAFVTSIGFDSQLKYASLRFGNPEKIPDELLALAYGRSAEARTRLTTPPDFNIPEAPAKTKKGARRGR